MTMSLLRPSILCLAAAVAVSACEQRSAETPAPAASKSLKAAPKPPPPPLPAGQPDCTQLRALKLLPAAERGEQGARNVLLEWARALENRQWDRAWCQFGDNGGASGQIFNEYARDWSAMGQVSVYAPTGAMEGAAGSSYYTASTRVTVAEADGKERIMMGEVILRRVNDVPGASEDELRWHVASARLVELPQ